MAKIEVLASSENQNWVTPSEIFDPLNEEFDFCLDAAATVWVRKCNPYFGPDHMRPELRDALQVNWFDYVKTRVAPGHKAVWTWVNPPYGRTVGRWLRKAYIESIRGLGVVMFVYARTDTLWFHDYCMKAAEIRFLKGRVKFLDPITLTPAAAGATAGHMAVIFRPGHIGPPKFSTWNWKA